MKESDSNHKPEEILSAKTATEELREESRKFGQTISEAFGKGIVEGKRFEDVLKGLRKPLAEIVLKTAFKPFELAIAEGYNNIAKTLLNPVFMALGTESLFGKHAYGNAFAHGAVVPFANGGIVGGPTYFPMARGVGLMGEAGPEAVMPLARGPDGRLGVHAAGAVQRPVNITVNISTPDAQSFRRSEAQVTAALARAVARGQRGL